MAAENATPVYCLDTFSEKAKTASFYIETLSAHLKNHAFVSDPHKHDHYLILYITKGGGSHTIDFRTYNVHPGVFFVMTPGQVHSWKLEEGTNGYIIFFENDFREFDTLIEPADDPSLEMIVKEMYKEKDLKIQKTWLEVLLVKLARYEPQSQPTFKIRKLEQLIEKNFVKLKKPSEYADLMNLSPAYLNNLCKKHLGKTLSDLINERVVLEAKRLFSYADLTVAQISHRLRFSEPSYFIRFFRKNTGVTPEQFKESTIRPIQ
jgi:AraC family transcriptional activator of pobA